MKKYKFLLFALISIIAMGLVALIIFAAKETAYAVGVRTVQSSKAPKSSSRENKFTASYPTITTHILTSTASHAIPDDACATIVTDVIHVSEKEFVYRAEVGVNISHTYRSDLIVSLREPGGQIVHLLDKNGDHFQNFDVWFDQDSENTPGGSVGNSDHDPNPPYYEYTWRPKDDLGLFTNLHAQGDWTLEVCDSVGAGSGGSGSLNFWTLKLDLGPARADLNGSVKLAKEKVALGQPIEYMILLHNQGALSAANVTLTDEIPYGTTYISNSLDCSQGTCSFGEQSSQPPKITWNGDIKPHQDISITFAVSTELSIFIHNTAVLTSPDIWEYHYLPVSTEVVPEIHYVYDFETGNDGFSGNGDWEMGTPLLDPPLRYGGEKIWGTKIDGNYNHTTVSVLSKTIDLSSLSYTTGLILQWWEWSEIAGGDFGQVRLNGTDSYSIGESQGYWGRVSLDISAYAGSMLLVEWVFTSDNVYESLGWYIDDVTVHEALPEADLEIRKTEDPDPVAVGDEITYTLTISNNGPSLASGVSVLDFIDSGFTPETIDSTQGSCAALTGRPLNCFLGDMSVGQAETVVITGTINNNAPINDQMFNTAMVELEQIDPNPNNNSIVIHTTVLETALTDPKVYSVTPESGLNTSNQSILIYGENFENSMTVTLGITDIIFTGYVSPHKIQAVVPAGFTPGTHDLTVSAPDGGSGTLLDAYTVKRDQDPTITRVKPSRGLNANPVSIKIYGSNFTPFMTAKIEDGVSSIPLENVEFIDSETIKATVPVETPSGPYSLVLTDLAGKSDTLDGAYRSVQTDLFDDLYTLDERDLWKDPPSIVAGEPFALGLNVRRQGGVITRYNVKTDFYLGDPDNGGTMLGRVDVDSIEPNGISTATLEGVTITGSGVHVLYAVLDSKNSVSESNEDNNVISRTVKVYPSSGAGTQPQIEKVTIDFGVRSTSYRQVVLNTVATGNPGYILYVEYQYVQSEHDWIPVQQSDWLPFNAASSNYLWKLYPGPGVHYIQAWVADNQGAITPQSYKTYINLNQTQNHIAQGEVHLFHFDLTTEPDYGARLTTLNGDADLYIFGPDQQLIAKSETGDAVEEIFFTVNQAGRHQLEVEGFLSSDYNLAYGASTSGIFAFEDPRDNDITGRGRTDPFADELPDDDIGLPDVDRPYLIYMPLINR